MDLRIKRTINNLYYVYRINRKVVIANNVLLIVPLLSLLTLDILLVLPLYLSSTLLRYYLKDKVWVLDRILPSRQKANEYISYLEKYPLNNTHTKKMKYRIILDGFGKYVVQRRLFNLVWRDLRINGIRYYNSCRDEAETVLAFYYLYDNRNKHRVFHNTYPKGYHLIAGDVNGKYYVFICRGCLLSIKILSSYDGQEHIIPFNYKSLRKGREEAERLVNLEGQIIKEVITVK